MQNAIEDGFFVVPAHAGIQNSFGSRNLDSGFLRSDEPFCIKLLGQNRPREDMQ